MAALSEKIKTYQDIVVALLQDHAQEHLNPDARELEDQVIADRENNHFQLMRIGWLHDDRIENLLMHFDIKPDGKIWVQANSTDERVAEELVHRGIPPTDIVLGLQPPSYRQYTEYAAA